MNFTVVRVAVVGAGDFGRRHIDSIAAMSEFDLVAVVDRDMERSRLAADQHGARAFTSLEEALGLVELDAVVIATPPSAHFEDLRRAVARGLHVLVEKPIVVTLDELSALEALAPQERALVLPAHISRYLPAFVELRQQIGNQRIRAIRAVRYVPRERLAMHGESHPALAAMVHDFDLIRALVPAELVSVRSEQAWIDPSLPHPQIVMAHLRFADGTLATVDNLWTMSHSRQYIDARMEVVTDSTSAVLAIPGGSLRLVKSAVEFVPEPDLEGYVYGMPVGALANQLRYFAARTRGMTTETSVTIEDAFWSVRLALEVASQAPKHLS